MKKFTLLTFLIVSLSSFGQNYIENGDFEAELQNWNNLQGENSSSAKFSVETRNTQRGAAMKIFIRSLGSNPWDIQSIVPVKLKKKKNYTLTFYGRTRNPGAKLKAVIQNEEYAEKIFELSTNWQKFTWEFKTVEAITEFKFQYFENGTFFIDEVSIIKN